MSDAKVTSLDVARLAGVSQSAVSRVFSGASASQTTIAKVRAAAEQLGYRPNSLARAMITGKSRIIALVVAYLDNQFYPVAIERLSQALQARDYHILLLMAGNSPEGIDHVMQELMSYQIDGIITASVAMSSDLTDRCAALGIPVVMFNRGQDGTAHSSVTSANVEGGRKVAEFLLAGGHGRIAHIAGWQGSSTGRDRTRGFLAALEEVGAPAPQVIDGMYTREAAAEAARTLMAGPTPPDAIFVGNDHMAFAVMDVLRFELGLSVPQDVSVVGYDDVPMAAWPAYDLTTLRQPLNRMVEATVATLLAEIDDPDRGTEKVEIAGPLVLRGSARIPQGWT
ncbi:LacI family DNA-binding transcriptional regulator [Roseicyclus persicicus]|uniref:LacI family DNA-binding transcriptional regulator n=1 Tax=Roseicyclus persicicus TaxID=2650661 RepID=A0A7X6GYA4_9RHOB|nr:LacI family DNA-binding transcriptional regulator [Roseibacterium persicicum]NKX43718.1 LacI family DNA-binding transcriptional regulator [Roseibacterium persicicum]